MSTENNTNQIKNIEWSIGGKVFSHFPNGSILPFVCSDDLGLGNARGLERPHYHPFLSGTVKWRKLGHGSATRRILPILLRSGKSKTTIAIVNEW